MAPSNRRRLAAVSTPGPAPGTQPPLLDTTADELRRTLDVNVAGVFHCYRSAARQMVTQGRAGRLIGAASVAAHRGGRWQSAYSASKFAVRGMSQSAAQELAGYGITVNVYSPGVVRTPMWEAIDADLTARHGTPPGSAMTGMPAGIPLGRLETPEDVAGVVACSPPPRSRSSSGRRTDEPRVTPPEATGRSHPGRAAGMLVSGP